MQPSPSKILSVSFSNLSISSLIPQYWFYKIQASSTEKHAHNSCYSFVLSGCSREVSNNTTIEFYNKHIDHLKNHHQEHLGHLKVDNKALPKPMRAQLDMNNIYIQYLHAALVESYKHLTTSAINRTLYKPFLNGDCNFRIFVNEIQKFGLELNGSYAQTADKQLLVTNAPVNLHSIKGSPMDRHKLAVDLMNVINGIKPVLGESVFSQFIKDSALGDRPEGVVSPPEYFKCCTVINIDYDVQKMELLFDNWPMCIAAYGCTTNSSTVEVLVNKIGLFLQVPDVRLMLLMALQDVLLPQKCQSRKWLKMPLTSDLF